MSKLSTAQVKAIEYVWAYENEFNPEIRPNTWAALAKFGLIARGINAKSEVTEEGQAAYTNTVGRDLPARYRGAAHNRQELGLPKTAEIGDDVPEPQTAGDRLNAALQSVAPAFEKIGVAVNQATESLSKFGQAAPANLVLDPVTERTRPNTTRGHRPIEAVQADREHLVRTHGEDEADRILDAWETVPNRTDRRRTR